MKDRTLEASALQPIRIKIDPGSQITGIAVVREAASFQRLKATGLPVTTGTGGRTQWNRQRLGILKTHALDAACVGPVTTVTDWNVPTLAIRATGRGRYQRTRLDRFGFPRGDLLRKKQVQGFQTGDRVVAVVPTGKKAGTHTGRVAVWATGSFNIQTPLGVIQSVSHRHCRRLQRADGYGYALATQTDGGWEGNGGSCGARCALPPRRERRGLPGKTMKHNQPIQPTPKSGAAAGQRTPH